MKNKGGLSSTSPRLRSAFDSLLALTPLSDQGSQLEDAWGPQGSVAT